MARHSKHSGPKFHRSFLVGLVLSSARAAQGTAVDFTFLSTLQATHSTRTPSLAVASLHPRRRRFAQNHGALSNHYLENDLVAIRMPPSSDDVEHSDPSSCRPRLCVVRPDGSVLPLCRHEDNVETDLFTDPRSASDAFWQNVDDTHVTSTYGEGWYGQRPVPSLGGGPGYGAEADEIWSIQETVLEQLESDGASLPILDVGIAHGEKARGGAY